MKLRLSTISLNLLPLVFLFVIVANLGFKNNKGTKELRKVYIQENNGRYSIIRNGKPYTIKGASGYTHLKKFHEIGGNTIRIYDTVNLLSILDDAQANNIAVVVGLPMADNKLFNEVYDDTAKMGEQFGAYKTLVEKFKNHPAVLMWCVGNEQDFQLNLKYRGFFKAYNNLVDMIHRVDPDHPVTTTVIDVRTADIQNIKLRTNTDLISINSFGGLNKLKHSLNDFSWFWKGPYMILEWGIKGPWRPNESKTEWEAFIEESSTKKAEQYLQTYQQYIPHEDPRFLGAFVFYWGQKQEYTHTWYSMFYKNGYASESVGALQYIFTGTWPAHSAPKINYMLLDNKGAYDNVLFKPGKTASAELQMLKKEANISNIKWELYHEDWYRKDNVKNTKSLVPIDRSLIKTDGFKATFTAPLQEGPYRLFATVFDKFGNFATCNTPFYVIK